MNRQSIIQKLINDTNAESYLEIGVGDGKLHTSIKCKTKVGVDPCEYPVHKRHSVHPTFKLTSDDFFKHNTETFDVIFIDGLHEANCVERDINNSLSRLNDGGFIVCHDMNPTHEKHQGPTPIHPHGWTGDCWKAWVKIRSTNPHLTMFVVNTDWGCGVIQKGSQKLLNLQGLELTYQNLEKNRKDWLNLISVEEFNK